MLCKLDNYFEKSTRFIALIGCSALLVAIIVTCLSIIGKLFRRLLNLLFGTDFDPAYLNWVRPILGEEEIVQLCVCITLFSILPWATLNRVHIRIDLLEKYFKRWFNKLLEIVADLSLVVITFMLMQQQWYLIFKKTYHQPSALKHLVAGNFNQLSNLVKTQQETQIISIPLWPFYIMAELLMVLFFLVAVFCLIKNLSKTFSTHKIAPSQQHNSTTA